MKETRKEIDKKDEEILHSFQERLQLVLKILQIKKERGILIKNLKREEEVLNGVLKNSFSRFYAYNKLLFLNIIEISKILQYEKLNIYFNKYKIKINYYNRKVKVFSFNVNIELFNLKKFLKFEVQEVSSLNLAFFKFKKSQCESLLILKTKMNRENIFKIALKHKAIINEIIEFKRCTYLIFSKNIYFKKGFNILILALKLKSINKIYLYLNYVEDVFEVKVLSLNVFKNKKNFSLFLSFRVNFKEKFLLFKFLNFFSNAFKRLEILGFLKDKHKNATKFNW